MSLKLCLHGVRGSRPTDRIDQMAFGCNSTSIEFKTNSDFYLILDGGTGLIPRGKEISLDQKHKDFNFIITHTHWDHILALPYFEPLQDPSNNITFYSSRPLKATFESLFNRLLKTENLPVPISSIKANISFKTIEPGSSFNIGDKVSVDTYQLNHQGITLGYRVNYNNHSACVVTDNAPIDNGNYMGEGMKNAAKNNPSFEKNFTQGLINFLSKADTVVYDTHFTNETLKADWGHSTPDIALDICHQAGVKRLLLFHHAPEDNDNDVRAKVDSVKDRAKKLGIEVEAATEGKEWVHG